MAMLIIPTEQEPTLDVVRGWIRRTLRDLPLEARLQATLVADELVTNARRHGRAPYVLRLDVHECRRSLLVSVDDSEPAGGEWPAGAGLVLVGALSRRWGVEPRRLAKTVWAELGVEHEMSDLPAPAQPLPRPRFRQRRTRP